MLAPPRRASVAAWLRRLGVGLAALGAAGALGVLLVSAGAAWLVTHPPQSAEFTTRLDDDVGWVRLDFASRRGARLAGWFAPTLDPAGTVIVSHGVGGTHRDVIGKANMLRQLGFNTFVFDFLGHGLSGPGVVTLGAGEVEDLLAAVDLAAGLPGVDPRRIAVLGDSMGGAVAIMAAARDERIAAVIAESSYARLSRVATDSFQAFLRLPAFPFAGPVQLFGRLFGRVDPGQVNPVEDIARISPRPVFLIHGEDDRHVPAAASQELYDAAGEPRVLWTPARIGHTGAFYQRFGDYAVRVNAFLRQALGRGAPPAARAVGV